MAIVDDLMQMDLHTQVLEGTFRTHHSYMTQLLTHRSNVSDRETMQALTNLHNVVSDLTSVVLDIRRVLDQLGRQSLDDWIRQTAARR
jgi:hypothetical protein